MLDTYMADITELRSFERLAGAAGPVAAMRMCAFFGPENLFIPAKINEQHVIALLIGAQAADWLASELGGTTVWIPALEMKTLRRAGKLRYWLSRGISASAAAPELGVTSRQARRLAAKLLSLEGYSENLITPESEKNT